MEGTCWTISPSGQQRTDTVYVSRLPWSSPEPTLRQLSGRPCRNIDSANLPSDGLYCMSSHQGESAHTDPLSTTWGSRTEISNLKYVDWVCLPLLLTHRLQNILLTKDTPDSPQAIKIADFGLAKMGELSSASSTSQSPNHYAVHAGTMLTSMVGTPQYLAPEVVMQTKQKPGYENVVDSWSVGIIVYR